MYHVEFKEHVVKSLLDFPPKIFKQVVMKALLLQKNPRPQDCKALKGMKDAYRVDQGEYRILYSIDDKEKNVLIAKIAHRSDVYRHL